MNDRTGRLTDMPLGHFAETLASGRPTPSGGAATALTAAFAASLTAMVARLSRDRPRYAAHADLHSEASAASDAARVRFLELADADAEAYAAYLAARRLPHATAAEEEAREAAIREAARQATDVPLETVRACHVQVELVDRLAGRSNLNAAADLEVAALFLDCAARAAATNVRANLGSIGDDDAANAITAELDQRLQQIQTLVSRARERATKGVGRRPEGESP